MGSGWNFPMYRMVAIRLRDRIAITAERRGLVISQEFHRHRRKLRPTCQ
jgi:hypothetical protein